MLGVLGLAVLTLLSDGCQCHFQLDGPCLQHHRKGWGRIWKGTEDVLLPRSNARFGSHSDKSVVWACHRASSSQGLHLPTLQPLHLETTTSLRAVVWATLRCVPPGWDSAMISFFSFGAEACALLLKKCFCQSSVGIPLPRWAPCLPLTVDLFKMEMLSCSG